jgi:hypothetical protein
MTRLRIEHLTARDASAGGTLHAGSTRRTAEAEGPGRRCCAENRSLADVAAMRACGSGRLVLKSLRRQLAPELRHTGWRARRPHFAALGLLTRVNTS